MTESSAGISRQLSCLVADDEPYARKGITGYIEKIEFLQLAGLFENAVDLNTWLRTGTADLLFLDIEMPFLSGIEFLKTCAHPPKVIFTTAYEKYALQGFELDVLDYLLKPVSFERFLKAANKAWDFFNPARMDAPAEDYFFVKAEQKLEKIFFSDILFVEAMENYVAIYTRSQKIISHLTLKMLAEKLTEPAFIQPHKSYLVAVAQIDSIEANILNLGKYQVPISKYQKEELMEKIVNQKLLRRPAP